MTVPPLFSRKERSLHFLTKIPSCSVLETKIFFNVITLEQIKVLGDQMINCVDPVPQNILFWDTLPDAYLLPAQFDFAPVLCSSEKRTTLGYLCLPKGPSVVGGSKKHLTKFQMDTFLGQGRVNRWEVISGRTKDKVTHTPNISV